MITEQQSEMIDYIIEGKNKSDISKLLGISRQTVYEWLKLKEVQEEKQKRLSDIKKSARDRIATKVNNCIDIIYDIAMTSKDARTKFQASKYLCDQFIGSPSAIKESDNKTDDNENIDKNSLKAELEEIKKYSR